MPEHITIRDVEVGHEFFVDARKLTNYNINTPRYINTVHWHDHFELELLDAGRAYHVINGNEYVIGQRDAYLVTPADVHTLHPYSSDENCVSITHISFNEAAISENVFNDLMAQPGPLHATLSEEQYETFQLLIRLIREESGVGENARRRQRNLCNYLVLKFIDLYNSQTHIRPEEPRDLPKSGSKNHLYINKAISYIKYNFRNPKLTTQRVAQEIFLTPNYFGELFYKCMHITCLDYIRKLKLNFAMSLLCQSNITVAEIAERSGYTSTSYFIKEFKAEFGTTPQTYRNQLESKSH